MCVVLEAVRLYPALLNDQLRCVLSQPGEFWQRRPWAAEHWCQKAAYLDGWVHYHLLITGGFSGVFITCADRGCVYVCVSPGVTVTPAELQGVSWCVSGGSRGSCFSSAVGSLQYSWALWGSLCCAALRPPLPLYLTTTTFVTTPNTSRSVGVHLAFSTLTLWLLYMHHLWCIWDSQFTFVIGDFLSRFLMWIMKLMVIQYFWIEAVNIGCFFVKGLALCTKQLIVPTSFPF